MKVPSHTTVVAYLALFVAIGGSAYAVSKIGSPQIKNHSIRGKDVAANTLGGRQVDEARLEGPVAIGDEQSGACDPMPGGAPIDCIALEITLRRKGAIVVIASASKLAGGSGICAMALDGSASIGEVLDAPTRDGFALTKVTPPVGAGTHSVALRCTESGSDFRIDSPTIAAVAVNSP